MASRYGQLIDLKKEVKYYINGTEGLVNRFLIRDFVIEVCGIECTVEELESAIAEIEQETGQLFPESSLSESMKNISKEDMKSSLLSESVGTILPTFDTSEHTM